MHNAHNYIKLIFRECDMIIIAHSYVYQEPRKSCSARRERRAGAHACIGLGLHVACSRHDAACAMLCVVMPCHLAAMRTAMLACTP